MDNDKEIIAVPSQSNGHEMVTVEEGIELVIARAEKQVKVLEKVLAIAVQRTNNHDWVDQNGKPYLTASGAEKLVPLFGVNLTDVSYEKKYTKDEKGDYYIYQYKGTFFWKAGSIEAIGACSSRDKFFAWDSHAKEFKPLPEVDETNIMKAAYSNMTVNGITRLLGIRNLTWEQLTAFGINKDNVSRVEYRNGNAGGDMISEPQQKRLYAIGKASGMPEAEFKEWLHKTYGVTTTKEIKREWYDGICEHVQSYRKQV
jgi:hypothetical protein